MQLLLVAVGTRMPGWVQDGWKEYARRFPRGLSLDLREIPLARRSGTANVDALCEAEGRALLAAVPAGFRCIALDQSGSQCTTLELAAKLEDWMRGEKGVCFLVGGPDGLSADCRSRADELWSLGRLTLPHPLVRVILAEQLYRALTVTRNHPYHRQ